MTTAHAASMKPTPPCGPPSQPVAPPRDETEANERISRLAKALGARHAADGEGGGHVTAS